jgi:hypothetical protein
LLRIKPLTASEEIVSIDVFWDANKINHLQKYRLAKKADAILWEGG